MTGLGSEKRYTVRMWCVFPIQQLENTSLGRRRGDSEGEMKQENLQKLRHTNCGQRLEGLQSNL